MTQRNLILGLAHGVRHEELDPFVSSLRRTGFGGEVRMWVADLEPRTLEALRAADVTLEHARQPRIAFGGIPPRLVLHPYNPRLRPIHAQYPRVARVLSLPARDRPRARRRIAGFVSLAHVARYFHYLDFLLRAPRRYDLVMLTDTRDVFFQRDPFDFDYGDGVNCFLEDESVTLASCRYNSVWLTEAFGPAVLAEIGDRHISCSGITVGTHDGVVAYLSVLTDWLARLPRQVNGIDQAVHNYLLHKDLIPNLHVIRNEEGPVLTLAQMPDPDPPLARDGVPVNVVHQYDRKPPVRDRLLASLAV